MLSRARAEAALGATFPLRPRRRVSGRPYGTMRASRRGGRSDPVSSRLYRPGDDTRLPVRPGDALYNDDGPPNALVDLALGREVRNYAPGELGARTVEVLEAAYRSAASGRLEAVRR